ncbi:MAG: hypothetical protein ACM31D_18505 [Bacteroidota bacterium]
MHGKFMGAVALVALVHGGALAGEHGHSHAAPNTAVSAEQGKLVPTDAALRQGMETIWATMAAALAKRPGPDDYPRIADAVEADIDRLTKTCTLEPDVDARLHLLLVRMFTGIERLRQPEKQQVGIAFILGALDEYGRTFDHPGWRSFGH